MRFLLDTAANLANSSDLSLKLWQHETSTGSLQAANLANSSNTSPEIWRPDAYPDASTAAVRAKDKTVVPTEGRNSISGSGRSASLAAVSAHGTSGRDTAANALPDAYAWGERSNTKSQGLVGATHAHSASSPINARPGKSETPTFTSISSKKIPASNYLQNIGNLEEAARRKAEERLSKLYLPQAGGSTLNISSAGKSAATLAVTNSNEEESHRVLKERESFLAATQHHESIMALAKERANKSIAQIDEDVYYKNPTLNTKYYTAALAIAEENGKERLVNHGKIDIGGGKFMSQSDIEDIAKRNVRPVLNEISEKAQAQRQADEERRIAEEEEKKRRAEEKRVAHEQKMAERKVVNERKAADKAVRNEEKAKVKAQLLVIKTEERQKKAAEKAVRDDEKAKEREIVEKKRAETRAENAAHKSKLKEEKKAFQESRRKEKLELKAAAAVTAAAVLAAKNAESVAKAEVQKLAALKLSAETKLEAARLAESQAESEAQAEKARADAAQAQAELAKAEADSKLADARRIEAEAEKARADAEAEKAKENQRLLDQRALQKEEALDKAEAEVEADEQAEDAAEARERAEAEEDAAAEAAAEEKPDEEVEDEAKSKELDHLEKSIVTEDDTAANGNVHIEENLESADTNKKTSISELQDFDDASLTTAPETPDEPLPTDAEVVKPEPNVEDDITEPKVEDKSVTEPKVEDESITEPKIETEVDADVKPKSIDLDSKSTNKPVELDLVPVNGSSISEPIDKTPEVDSDTTFKGDEKATKEKVESAEHLPVSKSIEVNDEDLKISSNESGQKLTDTPTLTVPSSEGSDKQAPTPELQHKITTSSIVSIKSGAQGELQKSSPKVSSIEAAVDSLETDKDAIVEIPTSPNTVTTSTDHATTDVSVPSSPSVVASNSSSSPKSPSKGRTRAFFSKIKNITKSENGKSKDSSKPNSAIAAATVTSAGLNSTPVSTTPAKKTGIVTTTDSNHGGVSAASAARAAISKPSGSPSTTVPASVVSEPTDIKTEPSPEVKLQRTFSGFSQGSREEEEVTDKKQESEAKKRESQAESYECVFDEDLK